MGVSPIPQAGIVPEEGPHCSAMRGAPTLERPKVGKGRRSFAAAAFFYFQYKQVELQSIKVNAPLFKKVTPS